MFETTFELDSPLSPGELAARFRHEFFEGQAESSSSWSRYHGRVDEQGFKLIVRGRRGMTALGTFEAGSPRRVRVVVDLYIRTMFVCLGLMALSGVGAVLWVFWDDWQRGRFTTPIVALIVWVLMLTLVMLPIFVLDSWARYRRIKSRLTRLFVPAPDARATSATMIKETRK